MIHPSLILDMLIHSEALKSSIVQREQRIEARPPVLISTEPRFSESPYRVGNGRCVGGEAEGDLG